MLLVLEYKKETANKVRWDNKYYGELFSLYIPKWRVPGEIPRTITVKIDEVDFYEDITRSYNEREVKRNSELRNKKITAKISRTSYHSKTVRYDPVNKEKAEIGSTYIPKNLLENDMNEILMEVVWS
jgi:hypothetical protein